MGSEYWRRLKAAVVDFGRPDDRVRCVEVTRESTGSTCELCGHTPILWVHVLHNERTDERRRVGSECVCNYKEVHQRTSGVEPKIYYPRKYHRVVERLKEQRRQSLLCRSHAVAVDRDEVGDEEGYLVVEEDESWWREYSADVAADGVPEGMGPDEIDWESFSWEPRDL